MIAPRIRRLASLAFLAALIPLAAAHAGGPPVGGGALVPPGPSSTGNFSVPCGGVVSVTPNSVPMGGSVTFRGSHYTCKSPQGSLIAGSLQLYQPGIGFTAIRIPAVRPNGTYDFSARLPSTLFSTAAFNGARGPLVSIPFLPGTYFFDFQLFAVNPPPAPRPTAARITVQPTRPVCTGAQLGVSQFGQPNGAAGSSFTTYKIVNHSTTACSIWGYPTVSLLNAQHQRVVTSQQPWVGLNPQYVVLNPNGSAYFLLVSSGVPTNNHPCAMYPSLIITPPNTSTPVTFSAGKMLWCGTPFRLGPVRTTPPPA